MQYTLHLERHSLLRIFVENISSGEKSIGCTSSSGIGCSSEVHTLLGVEDRPLDGANCQSSTELGLRHSLLLDMLDPPLRPVNQQ
jgi:hypothetical protein